MCGLIGWISKDKNQVNVSPTDIVAEQYEEQKSRGSRGFGMTEIFDDGTFRVSRSTTDVKMMVDLRLSDARHILLHHRLPTSSENRHDQTHPIFVGHEELKHDYYVNHNGVINNAYTLKTKHEELGYVYNTVHQDYAYRSSTNKIEKFNDSEAFAIEMARYLEGKTKEIESKGNQAFMIVQVNKETQTVTKVVIGTNGGHQLGLSRFQEGWFFASENNYDDSVAIEAEHATTFQAVYKNGVLEGFKELEDLPELLFAKEEVKALPPTKYSDPDYSTRMSDYKPYQGTRMGFQAPANVPPRGMDFITPSDARLILGEAGKGLSDKDAMEAALLLRNKENKDAYMAGKADSFVNILSGVRQSKLGEIFKGDKNHEAIAGFPYLEFAKLYAAGKIDEVEEKWNTYMEDGITTDFDFASIVEDALLMEPDFRNVVSLKEMEKRALNLVGNQMRYVASQLVPIFKLQAFMKTAIVLGHAYQTQAPKKEVKDVIPSRQSVNGKSVSEEEFDRALDRAAGAMSSKDLDDMATKVLEHEEAWGKLHTVKDCKDQAVHDYLDSADGHWMMYGTAHRLEECGNPKFHSIEYGERLKRHTETYGVHTVEACGVSLYHTAPPPAPAPEEVSIVPLANQHDEDAETALDVLGKTAGDMHPEDIMSEAGHIAETIRAAAQSDIESHLERMASVAADEGLALTIAKYEDALQETVGKASTRFKELASIVRTAKASDEYFESLMDHSLDI